MTKLMIYINIKSDNIRYQYWSTIHLEKGPKNIKGERVKKSGEIIRLTTSTYLLIPSVYSKTNTRRKLQINGRTDVSD